MNTNFTLPKSSVQAFFMQKKRKNILFISTSETKKRIFSTSIKIFCLFVFTAFNMQKAAAQLNLNFGKNVTLKSGTAKALNAKYLYSKVNDTLDCIVTIKDIVGNAFLTTLDNNDTTIYGGKIYRFQPIISVPSNCQPATTSYIRFNFQLIKTGTYNSSTGTGTIITPSDPVWFRAYDIDGNGDDNSIKEFVELSSVFTGTWIDAPSLLMPVTPTILTGASQYTINKSTTNGNNLSNAGNLAFNGFIYANTASSWDVVGGATVGSNNVSSIKHDSTNIGDGDRINCWSFNYTEVVPGVDFGDAPATYNVPTNGTGTIIPAYHLVPSIASNVTVYLGSVKPDVDYDPSGNISATVDDKNNTADDEDGFQSTYFPKFNVASPPSTYSCTVSATNTSGSDAYIYGYIDFNGDGTFDATKEKSALITIHSNSGALQYFTATFSAYDKTTLPSANNRYARFRISSNSAEVTTPTGKALNGEVEDYQFNTALQITGTVYDDGNGITDNLINGTGKASMATSSLTTPPTYPLYVILIDSVGKVLQSVPLKSDGTYTLDSAGTNSKFTVVATIANPVIGTIPVLASLLALPTGAVYTSEGITSITAAGDKLATGNYKANTATTDVSKMDFGWNAVPETANETTAISSPAVKQKYPLTTAFTGKDVEDGSLGSGSTFIINSLPANVTLYYNNIAVTAGQKITGYVPSLLTAAFTKAVSSTSFLYSSVDAAGMPDPAPATYTITSNSVLPLNDIVLSANLQNSVVKLTLVAKDENQVARYTWEQSTDGANFTVLGSAAYQATSASSNVYTFSTTPTGTTNVVYYRSVQYSLDGTTLISNTVAVKLNETASAQAMAMPTVIRDITNIKVSSATTQTISLNIVDNAGRMVMRKQVALSAGSNTFAVDGFDRIANGSYYIQIVGIDSQSVLKVIVQH